MSSGDTKGDTRSKYSKKNGENGKIECGNNKVKDSQSKGNNEVGSTAGSDLEMDSRILSALLTVCVTRCRSLYLFLVMCRELKLRSSTSLCLNWCLICAYSSLL